MYAIACATHLLAQCLRHATFVTAYALIPHTFYNSPMLSTEMAMPYTTMAMPSNDFALL